MLNRECHHPYFAWGVCLFIFLFIFTMYLLCLLLNMLFSIRLFRMGESDYLFDDLYGRREKLDIFLFISLFRDTWQRFCTHIGFRFSLKLSPVRMQSLGTVFCPIQIRCSAVAHSTYVTDSLLAVYASKALVA